MDVASLVAAFGDVILLVTMIIFVLQAREMARQSQYNAAATRASVYQAIAQQMQDLDKLFIANPHLRPYMYDKQPVPVEEPLRTQVLALAELFVDFFDNFVTQSGQVPPELYEPWRRYARSIMESSPAACAFWTENRDWYSGLLQEMLDPAATAQTDPDVQGDAARAWVRAGDLGETARAT